jgi:hypothetical protein
MSDRRWSGFAFGILVVVSALPLLAAPEADGRDEPWPMLLSDAQAPLDPDIAALQRRAQAALARLDAASVP